MENFRKYLLTSRIASSKTIEFYVNWVVQFFNHCHGHPSDDFTQADIDRYLKFKSHKCESWQLEQAKEAIEVYRWFCQKRKSTICLGRWPEYIN
ncbi:MAG: hypothetical protein GY697_28245 [Desulfobacterales bacterium]|nr:hypothetical protein [Desulfobacterales bacterium]